MMVEFFIQEFKKNGGISTPEQLSKELKITKVDALEILKFGEMVGIFFNPLEHEYHLFEHPSKEATKNLQEFLNKFYEDMKRRFAFQIFTIEVMAQKFEKLQPFFYDKSCIFWLWNHENSYWQIVDDVDMLNMVRAVIEKDMNNPRLRTEILNALKQRGRLNIPQEIKPSWIQFKDKIIDIETDEEFKATPHYFVTNPILWQLGDEEETLYIDKLFDEWIGEEHRQELYEIIAFSLAPNYFIHRIICLIGSGANGKSTYLNLIRKFVGEHNITSVSLDALMGSRFSGAKLLKKLICFVGETNFNTLQKTDLLKKLTGGDYVYGEMKNKNPFDFVNYAKLIMASNSLPMTADKTDGFYRRWKINDFSNKFTEEKDVLKDIPDAEFSNLARKCLTILKRLWNKRIFTNDGNFDERRRRYEEKSNPVMLYIRENFIKDVNSEVLFNEFYDGVRDFLIENGFRELTKPIVSKQLKIEGYDVKQATINNFKATYVLGICKKGEEKISPQTKIISREK